MYTRINVVVSLKVLGKWHSLVVNLSGFG